MTIETVIRKVLREQCADFFTNLHLTQAIFAFKLKHKLNLVANLTSVFRADY